MYQGPIYGNTLTPELDSVKISVTIWLDMFKPEQNYHHGDLAASLLQVAEQELASGGVEKFSLRAVARAAGVSHAAPAHHFGDTTGLLSELAAVGFERLFASQRKLEKHANHDPVSQLTAAGRAYVAFAIDFNALFDLMFVSRRVNPEHHRLRQAADQTYAHLQQLVAGVRESQQGSKSDHEQDVVAMWGLVHGIANLINAGHISALAGDKRRLRQVLDGIVKQYWQANS